MQVIFNDFPFKKYQVRLSFNLIKTVVITYTM